MWNGWSPKHLNPLKSSAGLISKLSLSTKAACRALGIEVTSTTASKTCRIYWGGGAIVCRAGVLPRTCSEDSQKASELREMLSVPGTVNMLGMQTMKGMWNLVPWWGLFVINAEVWGQIQLVAGEVNTQYVQSWAEFSIQHNASLVFHLTL